MDWELSAGTVFAGHRIDALAGRGGMGVVYCATHLQLDRQVAIKLLAPELSERPDFRERFKQESRLAASIDHPNVIPIYDAGEQEGRLFISMRFVAGPDLAALIQRNQRLAPLEAARLVADVGNALDAAHARGLVHRDVKPANVLTEGDDGVFLTDFGLTKRLEAENGATKTGTWIGTVDYMAPEQIQGEGVDARTDTYALGCVLFEALTGRVPFERDSEVEKLFAHLHEPPPRAGELDPELPPGLDAVVVRALAKQPEERYPSGGDLGRAALAAAAGRPARGSERSVATGAAAPTEPDLARTAPAPPPGERRRRRVPLLVRGRRAIVLAMAAAALAFAVGIGTATLVLGGSEPDSSGKKPRGGPGTAPGRIDRGTPPKVERFTGVKSPSGLAVERGSADIWVSDRVSETVSLIGADSGQRIGRPVPVGPVPDDVVIDDDRDRVYVGNRGDRTISVIDSGSRRPLARISVPIVPGDLALSRELGARAATLWVTSYKERRVLRLDTRTRRPLGKPLKGGGFFDVAANESGAWTGAILSAVTHYDVKGRQVWQTGLDAGLPADVALDRDRLWTANPETGMVSQLNAETGQLVGEPVKLGGEPTDVTAGESGVWVANEKDGRITRLDRRSGQVIGEPIDADFAIQSIELSTSAGFSERPEVVWATGPGRLIRIVP